MSQKKEQCKGKTRNEERCKNTVREGTSYCWLHQELLRSKAPFLSKTNPKHICFVAIPYGKKVDPDSGIEIDFEKIYKDLIAPAIENMGCEVIRAKDVNPLGRMDELWQWLIMADLAIVDVSQLNPNVMYELGIRHGTRDRGTILICEAKWVDKLPFDLKEAKVISYTQPGLDCERVSFGKKFAEALHGYFEKQDKDSPIYSLFPDFAPQNSSMLAYIRKGS